MSALLFDGTNDRVKWLSPSAGLASVPTGAYTILWLAKRGGTGTFDALGYLLSGSGDGTVEVGASLDSTFSNLLIDNGSGAKANTFFTNTSTPYLFVLSKASGVSLPRLGWKLGSAGAWNHEDLTNTDGNNDTANALELGAWQNGDFFTGFLGVFAAWTGAMTDPQKETLGTNWRTSDSYTFSGAGITLRSLIELNQVPASLQDLASGVLQSGLVAESGSNYPALAAETMDSWLFDGTGTGGAPTTAQTMAAVSAFTGAPGMVGVEYV